jgi:hypothetical protein
VSARLLATFCLTLLGSVSAFADTELVVYLKADPNQPAAPIDHMKRELASLMRSAGYRVEWGGESRSPFLAVVELTGTCALSAGYPGRDAPVSTAGALASTNVTDGQVLPFASVNCAALTRSLSNALVRDAAAQRDFYYGRALARVIAHELYHILMRTTDHSRNGVSRSCFTTADLVAERFYFEGAVLAQMRSRPQPVSVTAVADTEDATDR